MTLPTASDSSIRLLKRATCLGWFLVSPVAESAVGFLAAILGAIDKESQHVLGLGARCSGVS